MKKKNFIIIAGVLLIIAAAYYYFFPGKNPLETLGLKKKEADPVINPGTAVPTQNGNFKTLPAIVQDSNGFPLMEGKSGSLFKPSQTVKEIQERVNNVHGTILKVDGIYGPKTAKALNIHGLPQVIYLEDYYEIMGV